MATEFKQSFIYQEATAGKKGYPATITATDGECKLAEATTDPPLGVLAEDSKAQGATIGVEMGVVLKGIAGAAIAIGDRVGVEAEGKFSPLTNPAAFVAGAPKWCWGVAITAAAANNEAFTFMFRPSIIHTAD